MVETRTPPEWFALAEDANPKIFKRVAFAAENLSLPLQVNSLPVMAFWFLLNSMKLANGANREGMHANALAITRQCLEAISIIELGFSQSPVASGLLARWEDRRASAGELRKWLEVNVWGGYGTGLWSESWSDFMGKLCKAIQPYAHYSPELAQWQERILMVSRENENGKPTMILERGPKTYDPQKATRITLFHGLISFTLARIWIAKNRAQDAEFESLIERLRIALGKSRYLDGDHTKWDEQFWAMMWFKDGELCPE